MPGVILNAYADIPGMYGKIPVLGDFVTRRLTPHFVETWDKWLQSALASSKEQLGDQWLDIYLTSPIWHFILSPGICGPPPWAGILMPSVDKVGRYFPLTFAVSLAPDNKLTTLFSSAADWFEHLEQLALSVLDDNINLDELDRKLQLQTLPDQSALNLTVIDRPVYTNREDKLTFHVSLEKPEQMVEAFAQLGFHLLSDTHPRYSFWSTTGSEIMKPCLRVFDNLPPRDSFYELLIGQQEQIEMPTSQDERIAMQTLQDEQIAKPALADVPPIVVDPKRETDTLPVPLGDSEEKQRTQQWRSNAGTTVGKHRKINEDACLECPETGLWAVADGMGGHSAGDVASKTVIDALGTLAATGNLESFTACAIECLRTANTDLLDMAARLGNGRIIGSTVVVMLAVGKRCAAIWAGDSRLYQFRNGRLIQLTKDHSLGTELSPQELAAHTTPEATQATNIVTRALGAEQELLFDVITFEAQEDDLYLLCSDGLNKEISHHKIEDILHRADCRKSTQHLIELALERGARDNVTVVVAQAS